MAIEISDHLRALSVLDVDSKESNRINIRLTEKGFRILEVRLAIRFLILVYIPQNFLSSYFITDHHTY